MRISSEKLENTKRARRSRKSKDEQHNRQMKIDKNTNNGGTTNTIKKLKIDQLKAGGEHGYSRR